MSPENTIFGFVVLVIMIALNTLLVMLIWNNVIIKKFPTANIGKLNFWDALAVSVLCSLLFGGTTTIIKKCSN